jgi:hypothetical protein
MVAFQSSALNVKKHVSLSVSPQQLSSDLFAEDRKRLGDKSKEHEKSAVSTLTAGRVALWRLKEEVIIWRLSGEALIGRRSSVVNHSVRMGALAPGCFYLNHQVEARFPLRSACFV